jgi:hypothetical protein
MSTFCGAHRLPRADVDPIDSPAAALAIVELAVHRPLTDETVVVVLDAERRGRTVVVVDGTRDADSVLDVVERIAESIAGTGQPGCMVVASVRPGGGPLAGDDELWLEASELADDFGVELLEWFVIGGDRPSIAAAAWCPRDLLGERPRWTSW